ncbi:hypothetical protein MUP77_18810 [Candidatus Bathyarchaeota archaeon]|nr:hypothetical protein [Candidatus Bathyarchaeota archaeon]
MGKGFFKWFDPSNFLDTYQEWHAFVEGFSETFCFWRARYEPSPELLEDLRAEHHYYSFGRVVGFIALLGFGVLITKILARKR